jgi:hypothetical protein
MRRSLFLVAFVLVVAAILPRGLTRPDSGKTENPPSPA